VTAMLARIALFELRKRRGLLSSYIYFFLFLSFGYLMMIAAGGAFQSLAVGMGNERVHPNSPAVLSGLIGSLSYFGLLVTAAVFGQAVNQDFESGAYPLFFSAPISKASYLGGRFLGALLFMAFVFASIALGLWLGTLMPFVDRHLFGPNRAAAYLWPYVIIVVPNLLFTGAVFFSLATLVRKMLPVYIASVVLLVGYLVSGSMMSQLENKFLAALVDPLGLYAQHLVTEYWTVADKNSLLVPFQGALIANRLLWSALGLGLLGYTFYQFRFAHDGTSGRRAAARAATDESAVPVPRVAPAAPPGGFVLRLLARQTVLAFKETTKNVYFVVIVLAGVLFIAVSSHYAQRIYGTAIYPVTYSVVERTTGSFTLFVLIIITFYAGELTWRERTAGTDQLYDALPIPSWLPFASKLGALLGVQVLLLAVVMLTGIVTQTVNGYFHYELGLYVRELFGIKLIDYALLCVLAMTIQAIVNHKYVGHFLMVVYYLWTLFMGKLGLEHNLYKFDGSPSYDYSDMNGYGHFIAPVLWFDAYWAVFAVLLAIASSLLWVRGMEGRMNLRIRLALQRFSPALRVVTALGCVAFVALGGYIYYNTNVRNHYQTDHDREAESAAYEKSYRGLLKQPQPRIVSAQVAFEIYPESHRLVARGVYGLKNKTASDITRVYVNLPNWHDFQKLSVAGVAKPASSDVRLGFYTFELAQPLHPGDEAPLEFEMTFGSHGFRNSAQETDIVANGTFFNSMNLPSLGYQEEVELVEDNTRKKYGLAPKERMADVNDLAARQNNYITSDADWVSFEAEVSTSADQLAIAPGYLQKEWTAGGRRHFVYKMDSKILHFFSVLSARYQVRRDHLGDIALEIYYHPGHEYDLDRMMQGMKAALEYCQAQFGPYQHRQARIIEFPRYASFAQSFPNTIPYSESIGFIAKVDPSDEEDVDYPFYVTAHEIAHQWWAHQVIGGNVQGATLLSETMAQYSALMVMKHALGEGKMKRFLKYELDRYLSQRGFEHKREVPLARVENQQYIHYQKGSLVMYALQDYLGENVLNRALAQYVKAVKFQEPPYTNSTELLTYIRKVTPPDLQYLIDDLFESITLYDNRALSATYREIGKDRYEVKLKVSAKKLRADELGAEKEQPMHDLVDVGLVDEHDEPIVLEKRRLGANESEITLVASRLPAKAGIDPLNKLIDRKPADNLVRVHKE
jgi:hypothetical protein